MGRDFWKNFGVLIGAVLLSAIVSALIVWGMVAWGGLSYSNSARLFQAVGAVSVIFVGGVFAYWRLQIFRTFQPHLTITHEVSHRFVGDSYVHIAVTAHLHNSSRVKIELNQAFFLLQLLSPTTDEDIEKLYEQRRANPDEGYTRYIQWNTLDEFEHRWAESELIIELGASYSETGEFIVSSGVESVMIYTYFYNSEYSQDSGSTEGWSMTTVYDIE